MRSVSLPNLKRDNPTIKHFVIMGDSISDRGTMAKRKLFGFIPMSLILSLTAHTHNGKFTNAYTWNDDIGAMMASGFLSQHLLNVKHKGIVDNTDIADAIINGDTKVKEELKNAYNLDNDKYINYNNNNYIRTFCEGGLTSADYRKMHVLNPSLEAPRHMLSNLEEKREALAADDKKKGFDKLEKIQTLVIEWSGGNDLITVNASPTKAAAELAVNARLENITKLIEAGYCNFALFTLPDLSLTPRFQRKSAAEQKNAKEVSEYFNTLLTDHSQKLKLKYPNIRLDVFDINKTLTNVIKNPELFGFDKDKAAKPFVESTEYAQYKKGVMPASQYIFWDDIHPSNHTHAILAAEFQKTFAKKYQFEAPDLSSHSQKSMPSIMFHQFMQAYQKKLKNDKMGFFGFLRNGRLDALLKSLPPLTADDAGQDKAYKRRLSTILEHAQHGGGKRSMDILRELGWLNNDNTVKIEYLQHFDAKHAKRQRMVVAAATTENTAIANEEHNPDNLTDAIPMTRRHSFTL